MPFTRYPSTLSSQTSFTLDAGLKAITQPTDILDLWYVPTGFRGCKIIFGATISTGDNDAFNYRIWCVERVLLSSASLHYSFMGSGTATLGASEYIAGVAAGTTGRVCDTVTWTTGTTDTTPDGILSDYESAVASGGARSYSAANDTEPAVLIIPDIPGEAIVIEFDSTTGDPLGIFALIAPI